MQAVDAQLHDRPLAFPLHLQFQLAAALFHRLLDAGGMDAAVADQAFQGHPGHLAACLVEGGQGDGLGGIVDDEVHAGGGLQRADVAAFAADDAALHLIVGQGHHRDGGLAGMVGGAPADSLGDHVPGNVLAVVLQVGLIGGHPQGFLVGQLLVHLVQQHFAGVGLAQAGQHFQPLHLLGPQLVGFGQVGVGLGQALLDLFLPLFQGLGLFVQGVFFLVDPVLLPADLGAALLDLPVCLGLLGVHFGLHLEDLVLGLEDRLFFLLGRGLDRLIDQAGRLGLCTADLGFCGLFAVVETDKKARGNASSQCNDRDHDCDHDGGCIHCFVSSNSKCLWRCCGRTRVINRIVSISELLNQRQQNRAREQGRRAGRRLPIFSFKLININERSRSVHVWASALQAASGKGSAAAAAARRWDTLNAAHPKGRPARLCSLETPLFVLLISLRNIGPIVKGNGPKPGRIFLPGPPPLQKKRKTCILVASYNHIRETHRWIKQAHCTKLTYRS